MIPQVLISFFNKTSLCGRDISSREINVRRFCANTDPNQTQARYEFRFSIFFCKGEQVSPFYLLTYLYVEVLQKMEEKTDKLM